MNTIKMQQRGTLTLPKRLRSQLNLEEGTVLRISHDEDRIVLEKVQSHDTALLRDIKQSLEDIKRGDYITFSTIPEFKRKMKGYDAH